MDEAAIFVFVYGTLRRGERNHHLLTGSKLIADDCWTYGQLFDTRMGYPALLPSKKEKVWGELYSVSLEQLRLIDLLEDYKGEGRDNLYDRERKTIYVNDVNEEQKTLEAYVYVYTTKKLDPKLIIKSGDWKKR